jgi:ubiquinone/menaquinone biosynthesis C-methylase UbiE
LQNGHKNRPGEDVTRDLKNWLEKDGEDFLKAIGIKKGQVVLDFGCGEGHYSIPAAKVVGEKGRIYALDNDKKALTQLIKLIKKANLKNIIVIKRESKTFLENNSVDFVLCYDVIHYLKDRADIYSELYRVLKPKGIFSLYPKHNKNDFPLMELAQMKLEDIIREVEGAGFSLQNKLLKSLIHDDYYNEGYILNFRKD